MLKLKWWVFKFGLVVAFFGLSIVVGYPAIFDGWQLYGLLAVGLILGLISNFIDEHWLYQFYRPKPSETIESSTTSSTTSSSIRTSPPATRTTLFLIILLPLSLFVVTSTGSSLGVGLIIGLVSSLVVDMTERIGQPEVFSATFLQQFKRPFSASQLKLMVAGSYGWLLLVWLLALTR